ncbi:MAG: CopG family transcriptional regulator [Rickettsiales bacterium]
MQKNEPITKIINTGVKLDESLHIRLRALSDIKERTPHWLMKTAIAEYVEREESRERERQEDMERWQRYKSTGHFIANKDVNTWLQSLGTDGEIPCPK